MENGSGRDCSLKEQSLRTEFAHHAICAFAQSIFTAGVYKSAMVCMAFPSKKTHIAQHLAVHTDSENALSAPPFSLASTLKSRISTGVG